MPAQVCHNVLVTVDDQHHDLDRVAKALEESGLTNIDVMRFSGIIGGSVSEKEISSLSAVPGVQSVELQPAFRAT